MLEELLSCYFSSRPSLPLLLRLLASVARGEEERRVTLFLVTFLLAVLLLLLVW